MKRRSHPFAGWVVTLTGIVTFGVFLVAILAGEVLAEFAPGSRFGHWLGASDANLFSYWILCGLAVSIAQMVLHVLGYPTARRKDDHEDDNRLEPLRGRDRG